MPQRPWLHLIGILWALPNTGLGLAVGVLGNGLAWLGYHLGVFSHQPRISIGHNALQFHNNALMFLGALTLGHIICYGCQCAPHTHGDHEQQHTIQAQILGPFYLPAHLIAQLASILTFSIKSWRGPTIIHGKANFLESGPMSNPPRPWPIDFLAKRIR